VLSAQIDEWEDMNSRDLLNIALIALGDAMRLDDAA